MLKNWLKIYWYNTMKHKVYFLLTIVGLAIGITSVVLASLYYIEEKSYDQWNPNKDNVYVIENKGENFSYLAQPLPLGRFLKEASSDIESYMYYNGYQTFDVVYEGNDFVINKVLDVQNTFFEFFPFDFVYGDPKTALVNLNDIAIELSVSEKIFGKDINPIGEQINLFDRSFIISGVYELGSNRSSSMPFAVVNEIMKEVLTNEQWESSSTQLLIKTNEPDKALQLINEIIENYYYNVLAKEKGISLEELKEDNLRGFKTTPILYSLADIHMIENKYFLSEPSTNLRLLNIVIYLSIMILFLSIFNYVNLTLTQIQVREKEIEIRKALGASYVNLCTQVLFETFVTVFVSFVFAICCIEIVLPYVNVFLNVDIVFSIVRHVSTLFFILVIIMTICTSIIVFLSFEYGGRSIFKVRFFKNNKGQLLRNSLLVIQFIVACFFIIGSLIINKQVNYMLNKDLGFEGDQVINIPFLDNSKFDSIRYEVYKRFRKEAVNIDGIVEVASSNFSFDEYGSSPVFTFYKKEDENVLIGNVTMDYEFLKMLGIRLDEGRFFSKHFASDSLNNIIVNKTLVKEMQLKNPLGDVLETNQRKFNIVGVIEDFHTGDFENTIKPLVFMHHNTISSWNERFRSVYIKADVKQLDQVIKQLETVWSKYNIKTRKSFHYEFVDKQFASVFENIIAERYAFAILNYIVVFIALFGLFAVSSFTIGTRLKEIAIRKVLGANTQSLLGKLSYQYIIFCLLGFLLAVYPSYYFLNNWLSNYAYRIDIGWEVFVYSFLLILFMTLLIVLSRTYYATKVDILKHIQHE